MPADGVGALPRRLAPQRWSGSSADAQADLEGPPKTERGKRRIGLHPLLVAALRRHGEESEILGLYDPEGFVFGTRTGRPMAISNLRGGVRQLCTRAGLGGDWTTYELRHAL